jgi:hypothetical protein
MDFDDVNFKLICPQETPNIVQVHMAIKGAADLKKYKINPSSYFYLLTFCFFRIG